jgi:hypothetical protein
MKRILIGRKAALIAAAVAIMMSGAAAAQAAVISPAVKAAPMYNGNGPFQCLANAQSYCLDVKDSDYQSDQPAWLYSQGDSMAFEAFETGTVTSSWPFTNTAMDSALSGDTVFEVYAMNTYFTNLCMNGASGPAVLLGSCSGPGTLWVAEPYANGIHMDNVLNSDGAGALELLTAASDSDQAGLRLAQYGTGGWQLWLRNIYGRYGCTPVPPCF